jgi:hypothetical protein
VICYIIGKVERVKFGWMPKSKSLIFADAPLVRILLNITMSPLWLNQIIKNKKGLPFLRQPLQMN